MPGHLTVASRSTMKFKRMSGTTRLEVNAISLQGDDARALAWVEILNRNQHENAQENLWNTMRRSEMST